MKSSFISFLRQRFPQLQEETLHNAISEQLLSPFQVQLSAEQISTLQNEIKQYWQLRQWSADQLREQYRQLGLNEPHNFSVCMSYDFHINSKGLPELIEINTNAAFLALGLQLYQFLKIPTLTNFSEAALVEMFKAESLLAQPNRPVSIAILDEKPEAQRLYVEFLIYQQIFEQHNIPCSLADISETEKIQNASLVYNRYTDFFLEKQMSKELKELFNKNLNFSPNPYEYFLLADKQRLLDWNQQTTHPKPASLLPVLDLGSQDKEHIWSIRKNLFIKPKNSYGSKQAYKAASMSRKIFEENFNSNFIAQQLSTPSEIEVIHNSIPQKLKYDLRCFTYKDQLQLVIARLYQGQTTNLRTDGGGFAAVQIKN